MIFLPQNRRKLCSLSDLFIIIIKGGAFLIKKKYIFILVLIIILTAILYKINLPKFIDDKRIESTCITACENMYNTNYNYKEFVPNYSNNKYSELVTTLNKSKMKISTIYIKKVSIVKYKEDNKNYANFKGYFHIACIDSSEKTVFAKNQNILFSLKKENGSWKIYNLQNLGD